MKFAERMSRLGTETAFEVLARARELEAKGKNIVHLEIGEPDFDTPKNIREAAKKAIDDGWTHYGPSAGLPQVRDVIAEHFCETRGINATRENIVITPGGKPIMFFALMALLGEGDEAIYPNPGFPIYESVINFSGAKAVPIPLREEKNFGFDVEELRSLVTPRTKVLIINSPANPTGGVLLKKDLEEIAKIAVENDLIVMSDEIYCRILYGGKFESITQFDGMPDRTFILDGLTKTYSMTGWRVGYGFFPKPLAEAMTKLMTNCNSCTTSFNQIATIEALKGDQSEVGKMVSAFRERRDTIVSGLNKIEGITCKNPEGAFYVFPNIKATGKTSKFLQDYLLNDGGVACLSGTSFGVYGEGYLRFSYANSIENINEALGRIENTLKKL
ncbi:pyridoxal phosphate-dependent aminotransferase [bacterium]|nr:pyridoxal phosphate-dependent aminotransferase [bacterium]